MKRQLLRLTFGLSLVAVSAFAGCESMRGPGFEDKSLDNVRKQEPTAGNPYGFSTKAQEIERNLGYR